MEQTGSSSTERNMLLNMERPLKMEGQSTRRRTPFTAFAVVDLFWLS